MPPHSRSDRPEAADCEFRSASIGDRRIPGALGNRNRSNLRAILGYSTYQPPIFPAIGPLDRHAIHFRRRSRVFVASLQQMPGVEQARDRLGNAHWRDEIAKDFLLSVPPGR